MNLHVKKIGNGHPLIILHGLFGSGNNWHSLGKRFSEHFTVYLIDQRNHGESVHCDEMNYELMANDLAEYCTFEKIERAYVLGHSMGGKTAMMFSALFSSIVQKLIVIDISPKTYKPHHNIIIDTLKSVDFTKFSSRKEVDTFISDRIPETGVRQFLLKNLKHSTKKILSWKMNLQGIELNYSALAGFSEITPVGIPTLFIAGSDSNYITEEDEELIYSTFYNSDIEIVEDAGHWVHAEKPDDVYNLAIYFLSS